MNKILHTLTETAAQLCTLGKHEQAAGLLTAHNQLVRDE